ncbi:MAG: tetratricopeptide repeat protein [Planctomycetota bacterium]
MKTTSLTFPRVFSIVTAFVCCLVVGCASQSRPVINGGATGGPSPKGEGNGSNATDDRSERDLDKLLKQKDFDLALGLLLFSEKYYGEFSGESSRNIDIEAKLVRFDQYIASLKNQLRRDSTPHERLSTLADFVHTKLGLRFDPGDQQGLNPDNLFFDVVLQRRYGYCVTLSLAYLVFGQAAGLDLSGVRYPGHFAVLYRDTGAGGVPYEVFIESTDFGRTRTETDFFVKYRFSVTSVENGVFQSALNDRQVFGTVYNNLAGLTYNAGKHDLAIKRYNRALELAPNNAEVMYNRAIVFRETSRPKDALTDLNKAIRLAPNFVLAYIARAGLLFENGEKEAAYADLNTAKRKKPNAPEVWMLEGAFYGREGEIEKARTAYHKCLELDPEYNSAHVALAELESKAGNREAALKHARAAGLID